MQCRGSDVFMRMLNKKQLEISQIGLGTGRFGTLVEKEFAFVMMDYFVDHGGNLLDTARNYYEWVENGRGMSEKTIGEWMEQRNLRNKMVISTKCGVSNQGKIFTPNLSKENLLEECKESKEALRTDYIDIYLLHRDEPERPVEEIVETLQVLAEESKARFLGVCNWSTERVKKADAYAKSHGLREIEIVQTWWSIAAYTEKMWNDPTTTGMDGAMYQYLLGQNKWAMAYTSQAKGFFQKAIQQGLDQIPPFLKERVATEENIARLQEIERYCKEKNVSPTAAVNGYITQNDLEGVALVSCSKMEQLEDIMTHASVEIEKEWIRKFDPRE